MSIKDIPVGTTATLSLEVTHELTVAHLLAGMPEVFSTPSMISLVENAAAEAIRSYLEEGWVSVGVSVNIKHLAATPIGFTATATATVTEVNDPTVTFAVEVHDGVEKVGAGTHVRAPIDLQRFEKGCHAKMQKKNNAPS